MVNPLLNFLCHPHSTKAVAGSGRSLRRVHMNQHILTGIVSGKNFPFLVKFACGQLF